MLVVNGGQDPKFKRWFELLIEKLDEHSIDDSYVLYVWNNNVLDLKIKEYCNDREAVVYMEPEASERLEHFHAVPLQRLYEAARAAGA